MPDTPLFSLTALKGAVVRTRRAWPGGIHKAAVQDVFERNGEPWACGQGWAFPLRELELVRPALAR